MYTGARANPHMNVQLHINCTPEAADATICLCCEPDQQLFFRYEDSTVHLQYTRICVTEAKSLLIAIFILKLVM